MPESFGNKKSLGKQVKVTALTKFEHFLNRHTSAQFQISFFYQYLQQHNIAKEKKNNVGGILHRHTYELKWLYSNWNTKLSSNAKI